MKIHVEDKGQIANKLYAVSNCPPHQATSQTDDELIERKIELLTSPEANRVLSQFADFSPDTSSNNRRGTDKSA